MQNKQLSFTDMAIELCGEKNDKYEKFIEKFKAKHTTDDCFTPENIYNVVADWVSGEYGVSRDRFVRPFYPGGDFENYDYPDGCIVVDNPPFSIISEIERFYLSNNIDFFLFAPALTIFKPYRGLKYVCIEGSIEYENGAIVNTSFVTNLGEYLVRSAPELYKLIKNANWESLRKKQKELPKYSYPDDVLTATMVSRYSKYGVDFAIREEETFLSERSTTKEEKRKRYMGAGSLYPNVLPPNVLPPNVLPPNVLLPKSGS